MKLEGKIVTIGEIQEFANNFRSRSLILNTEDQYPQVHKVEFIKEKVYLLDDFNEGDTVSIDINLRGREWTSPKGEVKYFTSITGWRIENNAPIVKQVKDAVTAAQQSPDRETVDDLPF